MIAHGKAAPRKLVLQWHITDQCNCRCTHCYQEQEQQQLDPDWNALMATMEQFKELLANVGSGRTRGQITITGGEPFMRGDFLKLLAVLAENKQYFDVAILSNGTLINEGIAKRIASLQPLFVQVSIEGGEYTHDQIRGTGNYRKTVKAIEQLVQAGVRVFISFTAQRGNFREFSQVAELGSRLKVTKVWADRHIPMGAGEALQSAMLTPAETQEFFLLMEQARQKISRRWFSNTKISLERGLQFLVAGGFPYHCAIGSSLITVMPNGDVYPCRRMPIKIANVAEQSLLEIYQTNPLLLEFRQAPIPVGCEQCIYGEICGGGLACLAYATYQKHFIADPGCWYARRE